MPTRKTYIKDTQGKFTVEVVESAITGKTQKDVSGYVEPPFTLSPQVASSNRLQSINHRPYQDNWWYCQTDRTYNDSQGRRETLAGLKQRGHSVFRCNNTPTTEKMYNVNDNDYNWLYYDNSGANKDPERYNTSPDKMLTDSVDTLFAFLDQNIVSWPQSVNVKYAIGNFEYFYFNETNYNASTLKDVSFKSFFDGSTTTIRQIYNNSVNSGLNPFDMLNYHLHAKRRIFEALWIKVMRRKSPWVKITNGDKSFFNKLNPNGELFSAGNSYSIRDYMTLSYDVLKNVGMFESIPGSVGITYPQNPSKNGILTYNNVDYNLNGLEYDNYDFFVLYDYYTDAFCKQADYNELATTNDPAKRNVDYWNSKIRPSKMAAYSTAVCYEVRKRFFDLHTQTGGTNFNNYPVIDMMEHQYEMSTIHIINADGSITYNKPGTSIFMPWVTPEQTLIVPKELVWIRKIVARFLLDGMFVWWTGGIDNTFDFDYTTNREQYYHLRSQEEHQRALDALSYSNDIFTPTAPKVTSGITYRWRRNNGTWTQFAPSPNAVFAAFPSGSTNFTTPYILKREQAGVGAVYAFLTGQEDTDVTEIEWLDNGNTYSVKLYGLMPEIRTIRRGLPTQ